MKLFELQKLPLEEKINLSKQKIKEFYNQNNGKIAVSFSGGKDSSVLLHLTRTIYPNIKGVFFNTTNEDSRIMKFVKSTPNIIIINPKKTFKWTLKYEGYPLISKEFSESYRRLFKITHIEPNKIIKTPFTYNIIKTNQGAKLKIPNKWLWLYDIKMIEKLLSIVDTDYFYEWYDYDIKGAKLAYQKLKQNYEKALKIRKQLGLKETTKINLTNKCCDYLKKYPAHHYQQETNEGLLIGIMMNDSKLREKSLLQSGCFNYNKNQAYPLAFWTENDIWNYINKYKVLISKAYDTESRTGCIMCGFGLAFDYTRFDRIDKISPKRKNSYFKLKNIQSDITFGEAVNIIISYLKNLKGV